MSDIGCESVYHARPSLLPGALTLQKSSSSSTVEVLGSGEVLAC